MKLTSIFLFLLLCAFSVGATAQNSNEPPKKMTRKKDPIVRPARCPVIYATLSTGFNNNTGVTGVIIDVPIEKFLSVEGGAGRSTWGNKLYFGGKYYTEPCHRGWAFGTGITYNTGLTNFQDDLETVYGRETVLLNFHSQTNVLFAAYRYWNLGKRYNRFYLEFGYSVNLNGNNKYDEIAGDQLTNQSDKVIRILAPGGFIGACGFSFSLH